MIVLSNCYYFVTNVKTNNQKVNHHHIMKNLLAIDTSHGTYSICLNQRGKTTEFYEETEHNKQAENIIPSIETTLAKHKLSYQDLDAIAICIGPGSFTGIRIGIAAAQGIALVHNIPLISVTTLHALAHKACTQHHTAALTILDAKREQLYVQSFNHNTEPTSEAQMIYINEIETILNQHTNEPHLLVGNGLSHITKDSLKNTTQDPTLTLPNAEDVANAALHQATAHTNNTHIIPLYIRPPDAKKAQPK